MHKRIMFTAITAFVLSACTPVQLDVWTQITGNPVSSETRQTLLDQPDYPLRLADGRSINADGSVTPPGKCSHHYAAAMRAGWSPDQWSKLDVIMWRESRCFPTAYNGRGRDDSYGLLQLNMKAHRKWVSPLVGGDLSRLYDAETNLRVGKELFDKARAAYGCGFQPWKTTKQRDWCN